MDHAEVPAASEAVGTREKHPSGMVLALGLCWFCEKLVCLHGFMCREHKVVKVHGFLSLCSLFFLVSLDVLFS